MASIVETKAVALRRGNHPENMAFTGVQGEVTVDLGYEDKNGNLGTDINTTLRLHNGVTKAGIPMARADMMNVSSELLAENRPAINDKNLAYADLSNIEVVESNSAKNKIISTFKGYGFAREDEVQERLDQKVNLETDNLNTSYLVSEEYHPQDSTNGNKPLAYADTSNINTVRLVSTEFHNGLDGNKPLSYGDFSTSDTTNLTKLTQARPNSMSGPVIAANDCSNVNTTYLTATVSDRPVTMSGPVIACADLSNIPPEAWSEQGIIEIVTAGLEKTENKDNTIDPYNVQLTHYPRTQAVIDYTSENCLNTSLSNAINWNSLFYNPEDVILDYTGNVTSSDAGFIVGDSFKTGILLKNDPKISMYATVDSVDSNGSIQALSFYLNVGSVDLSSIGTLSITSDTNSTATFTITSTGNVDGTYDYLIDSILSSGSGFVSGKEYIVKDSNGKILGNIIYVQPEVVVTNVDSQGKVTGVKIDPICGLTSINTTAATQGLTVYISSDEYNLTGGAGALKHDLTNLGGMSDEDMSKETNSPWRIRHDEGIPSFSEVSIPDEQNYTIATNGNVWRALKNFSNALYNIPSTTFNAQFVPSVGHSTDSSIVNVFDYTSGDKLSNYSSNVANNKLTYMLLPNHEYTLKIENGLTTDNYHFLTGEPGTTKTIEYSVASITFNLNIQAATLTIETPEGSSYTYEITNGTFTKVTTSDFTWTISKEGYSTISGSIDVEDGDQTFNVYMEEESFTPDESQSE